MLSYTFLFPFKFIFYLFIYHMLYALLYRGVSNGLGLSARRNEALGPSRGRPFGSLTSQRAELKKFLRTMAQPPPPPPPPLPFQQSCDRWWNTPTPFSNGNILHFSLPNGHVTVRTFPTFFFTSFFFSINTTHWFTIFDQISLLISHFLSQVDSIFSHIL